MGDNGLITNAQNANMKNGMAALEEWLQEEYVKHYDTENSDNKIESLLYYKPDLCLKDGTRSYIFYGGKAYYLLNKQSSSIPKEVKEGLKGISVSYSLIN